MSRCLSRGNIGIYFPSARIYIYIYTGLISMKFGQANIATIFRVKKLIAIAT